MEINKIVSQFSEEKMEGRGLKPEEIVILQDFYYFLNPKKTPFADDVLKSLFGAFDWKPEDEEKVVYHSKRNYRQQTKIKFMRKIIQEKYDLWHNAVG